MENVINKSFIDSRKLNIELPLIQTIFNLHSLPLMNEN